MSKNLVFCADGTWNGPDNDDDGDGIPDTTNVWKLFTNLSGQLDPGTALVAKEQEKVLQGTQPQVAKYLHGVGDSANPISKLIGGVFGAGVIARIVRGYTFISRNYDDGDRIYLIGFSRGAYTARALAGLIAAKGVLNRDKYDPDDKALAYRLGTMAWRSYRQGRIESGPADAKGNLVARFQDLLDDLPLFASRNLSPDSYVPVPSIRAVAVWDTVGALGIPVYVDNDNSRADVFRFADTDLSPKVEIGFHAISLDEQRSDFVPTLWQPRANVTQVVFPGAHADVGGGYPTANGESGLSDGALDWMMRRLSASTVGLYFNQPFQSMSPDAKGTAHQPWRSAAFVLRPSGPRDCLLTATDLLAHVSVRDRKQAAAVMAAPGLDPGRYEPAVWPTAFASQPDWVQ